MTKLDDLIQEALADADQDLLKQTEELDYFSLSFAQFRGKLGWVTWVIMILQTLMFLIGVWCAIRFFGATEVITALKWGISGAVLLIMGITLKLSLVPQMQADRVIREIKRVELLLASR